ncbi:MAG: hypothetical protein AAGE84_13265 [Cyanobacteria bacterium P01_G01_bin.39]
MPKVYEIKFFIKEAELFAALFAKPSILFPEFWIDNIKASKLGFERLPDNVELKRKYKVKKLGLEPFEFSKEGLAFGISDFTNRVTQDSSHKNHTYITNNHILNNYEQKGNFGIGHMSGGSINDKTKVSGFINEVERQNVIDASEKIQALLKQLEQTYNTTTTTGKMAIAVQAIELIDSNPTLARQIFSILKTGGIASLEQSIDHPAASLFFAALKDWQSTQFSDN